MVNLANIETEKQNINTMKLDEMSVREALNVMNDEDQKVPEAIAEVIPEIEKAIKIIINHFNKGGRLIYIGAGTSGRLGVLDAAECPPTFGTSPEKVIGLIAGGERAFTEAIEGSEDNEKMGKKDLINIKLKEKDVVVGLAASGRTPYVVGALNYANKIGSPTIAISCNKDSQIGAIADVPIEASAGPEVLTGSTRLKAGSIQKMILNMLSTLSMVGIGKVYKNLMVDVQTTNKKLVSRAEDIIMKATGVSRTIAKSKLKESEGKAKVAIIMILLDINKNTAMKKLEESGGHVRSTL